MRRTVFVTGTVILVVCLLLAGCGSTPPVNLAGKTYLNGNEEVDSRTIVFNADGTFKFSIVTSESTIWNNGKYVVEDGKVKLVFDPTGMITEFVGKTQELKVDNQWLIDPDGSTWQVY